MATLWQFFGFPDPDITPVIISKPHSSGNEIDESTQTTLEGVNRQKLTGIEKPQDLKDTNSVDQPTQIETPPINTTSTPRGWKGPVTPDGEAFHDMSVFKSHRRVIHADKALRYVRPDEMHRLPLDSMSRRIAEGDTIIIDLRPLIHMDAHKDACRRQLRRVGEDTGVSVFALDSEDQLLLMPGCDVVVDVSRHELGLRPMLI